MRRLCALCSKPPYGSISLSSTRSPAWPNGVWPRSCAERDRLGEVLVQAENAAERAGDLAGLDRVRQARPVVVALVIDEDLGLVLEAAEGGAVDDAVAVALEREPKRMLGLVVDAPLAIGAPRSVRGEAFAFPAPELFAETVEVHGGLGGRTYPTPALRAGSMKSRARRVKDPDTSFVVCYRRPCFR